MYRLLNTLVVCGVALGLMGCGGGGTDPKFKADQQATITGTIKFGDKNLPADSQVTFFDQDQSASAAGLVDSAGKFTLKAANKKIGIPAGRYKVTVSPPPAPEMSEEEYQKMMSSGGSPPQVIVKEIPDKYRSAMTSGLAFEVKPGPNSFDLDLAK